MKPLPKFTAVVHVESDKQAIEQADLVLSNGAGGVFLICHDGDYHDLIASYYRVRDKLPGAWLGLNFLDLGPHESAYALPPCADALWLDNADGLRTHPDDDFIDLHALLRNVCVTIRNERRELKAFNDKFEAEYGKRSVED